MEITTIKTRTSYYVYKNGKWELYYQDGFINWKMIHIIVMTGYHYYVLDDSSNPLWKW